MIKVCTFIIAFFIFSSPCYAWEFLGVDPKNPSSVYYYNEHMVDPVARASIMWVKVEDPNVISNQNWQYIADCRTNYLAQHAHRRGTGIIHKTVNVFPAEQRPGTIYQTIYNKLCAPLK